jgi:hypothetical protein
MVLRVNHPWQERFNPNIKIYDYFEQVDFVKFKLNVTGKS